MRTVLVILGIIFLLAQGAYAGAWLREKGTTFNATSFTLDHQMKSGNTSYLEHGLTEKTTIGIDFGQFRSQDALPTGSATFFLRRALLSNDRPYKLSYELGIGTDWDGPEFRPHIRTGLSYGRGVTWRGKSGWFTVDGLVTWNLSDASHVVKIDTTLGLNFNEKWAGMMQLYVSHLDGKTHTTLAPSVTRALGNSRMKLQVGFETPVRTPRDTAIKFGVWTEF